MMFTCQSRAWWRAGMAIALLALDRSSGIAERTDDRSTDTSTSGCLCRYRPPFRQQSHAYAEARAGRLRHPVPAHRPRRSRSRRRWRTSAAPTTPPGCRATARSVETVEHLLAALVSMGVDNVVVELDHREVPIMDGSSAPFVYLIQEAGVKTLATPRRYLKVLRPITLSRGDKLMSLYPSDSLQGHLQHQLRSPAAAAPVAHAAGRPRTRSSRTSRRRGPSGS